MKYRKLDINGDYSFGKNLFVHNIEAVAQAIKTRLYHLLGEWWENTEDGLPLFENILGVFGTVENIAAIDLIISERILKTQGVKAIKSYESNFENRQYSAHCVVETAYGNVDVEMNQKSASLEVNY